MIQTSDVLLYINCVIKVSHKTYLQFHYKHLNMLELYVRQDINKYLRILIY